MNVYNPEFHNIIISTPIKRGNLRRVNGRFTLGGIAQGGNIIILRKFYLGPTDIVESYSIAKLVSHESIHLVLQRMFDSYTSTNFDQMAQNRSFIDGCRRYIQFDKFSIMFNEENKNPFNVSIKELF